MQDKLIEAVAVAYNKAKCAHDQKACMGGIEAAIAAVRAHDAQSAAEQPVGDVVSRMCKLMGGCACEHCIKRMTAALAVAREGYYSQQDVEKAIRTAWARDWCGIVTPESFEQFFALIMARLAPKEPSPDCQWSAEVTPEELDAAMVNYPKMDREAIFRIVSDYQAARNKRLLPKTKA